MRGRLTRGLISLPILLLLLFVISLSQQFDVSLSAHNQWTYQSYLANKEQSIWLAFEYQVIGSLTKQQAQASACDDFCALPLSQEVLEAWTNIYAYKNEVIHWQLSANNQAPITYRLCAYRPVTHAVRCWWLREKGLRLYWFAAMPVQN